MKTTELKPSPSRYEVRCATCGSDDVRRDAWAEWSVETQAWELAEVYQAAHCNACGGETSLSTRQIDSAARAAA